VESEDPSAIDRQSADSLKVVCAHLRRRAFRATNKLSFAGKATIVSAATKVLEDLASCINAVDVHLFRVAVDETGAGQVGLRYHTKSRLSPSAAQAFEKFQFRLLPSRVQDCIKENQIAKLSGSSEGCGRILSALFAQVSCQTYYLCPLFIDGKVRGVLGLACREEFPADDVSIEEFFDLLKLNSTILLINILRVRRESKRAKKLTKWRRIADQACDFAITVNDQFDIENTAAFGAGDDTPTLDGLRLTDIVVRTFHRDLVKQINTAVENSEVRTTDFQVSLGHEGPRWYLARIEPSRSANGC
jgi:hypothetical protein